MASAFRIPVAPIGTGATIPTMSHFREVGTYVDGPEPGVLWPRIPYLLARSDGVAGGPPRPAPPLGGGPAPAP